jgi:hypothetical protein
LYDIHWGICLLLALLTFLVNFIIKLLPDTFSKEIFNNELALSQANMIEVMKGDKLKKISNFNNSWKKPNSSLTKTIQFQNIKFKPDETK